MWAGVQCCANHCATHSLKLTHTQTHTWCTECTAKCRNLELDGKRVERKKSGGEPERGKGGRRRIRRRLLGEVYKG